MKRISLAALLIVFSFSLSAQKNCKTVKNGTFKTISEGGTTIIIRKGSLQTEENASVNFKGEFKIKWLDECTYTIQPTKIYNAGDLVDVDLSEVLTVKILKVADSYYLQETSSNKREGVVEGKVYFAD